jgi:hypothetical protein
MTENNRMIDDLEFIINGLISQANKSKYDSQFNREPVLFKKGDLDEIIATLKEHLELMVMMYENFNNEKLMNILYEINDELFWLFNRKKKLLWIYTFEYNPFMVSINKIENKVIELKTGLSSIKKSHSYSRL